MGDASRRLGLLPVWGDRWLQSQGHGHQWQAFQSPVALLLHALNGTGAEARAD